MKKGGGADDKDIQECVDLGSYHLLHWCAIHPQCHGQASRERLGNLHTSCASRNLFLLSAQTNKIGVRWGPVTLLDATKSSDTFIVVVALTQGSTIARFSKQTSLSGGSPLLSRFFSCSIPPQPVYPTKPLTTFLLPPHLCSRSLPTYHSGWPTPSTLLKCLLLLQEIYFSPLINSLDII